MAIIGNPFDSWVDKQIKVRQNALGQGLTPNNPRTLDTLKSFNSATPWIRLSSAINITSGNETISGLSVQEIIEQSGMFDGFDWKGDALSKNFVLMGAPINNQGGNHPYGKIDGNNALSKAYGYGYKLLDASKGRGYVPPPGILSAEFEYKNDGALAFATINVKAYSDVQFSMIDILFQRPGYTCLLEFGHTMFLGNDKKIKLAGKDVSFSTEPFNFLYNAPSQNVNYLNLTKKISKEKEKWEGNYEGFFGRVSKFNWKFNEDGSYDIVIKLVGTGDVISSLKSNSPKIKGNNSKATNSNIEITAPSKDTQKEATQGTVKAYVVADAIQSQLNFELYSIYADSNTYPSLTNDSNNFGISDITLKSIPVGDTIKDITIKGGVFKADVNDWWWSSKIYTPITSIKFGAFLGIIQKVCNVKDQTGNHMLQFSMVNDLASGDFRNDDTYYVTYPGNFSSNPNKCLVCYYGFDPKALSGANIVLPQSELNTTLKSYWNDQGYKTKGNTLVHRLSDVWVDIGFIASCLSDLRGANKDSLTEVEIPILDLLNAILSGINNSLGGINNFRVVFNENTNQIDIFSESPITMSNIKPTEFSTINTFGLTPGEGSFITGMDLNSELTDQMATQITIGAQANSNTLSGGGSTAFSSYSKGLVDRMFADKRSSLEEDSNSTNNQIDEPKNPLEEIWTDEVKDAFSQVYEDREFGPKYIPTLENIEGTLSTMILNSYTQSGKGPVPFFLPFNFNLTMHGLGGIKIFQGFQIQGRGLPPSYNSKNITLIIKSLSHTIDENGWKTKISTISKPNTEDKQPTGRKPQIENQSLNTGNNSNTNPPPNNQDKLNGTFDQDVTATWNNPSRKKIIQTFGWPITVEERGGKFYGKKIGDNGGRTVYEVSGDYRSRNNKMFTYTFKNGKTITKLLHQGIHEPLKQTLSKIDEAGFADGIINIDASIYARDTTGVKGTLSGHSFGVAMDFNSNIYGYGTPFYNEWVKDVNNPKSPNYKAARAIYIAKSTGLWNWGGDYKINKDTHHFTFKPYSS